MKNTWSDTSVGRFAVPLLVVLAGAAIVGGFGFFLYRIVIG